MPAPEQRRGGGGRCASGPNWQLRAPSRPHFARPASLRAPVEAGEAPWGAAWRATAVASMAARLWCLVVLLALPAALSASPPQPQVQHPVNELQAAGGAGVALLPTSPWPRAGD